MSCTQITPWRLRPSICSTRNPPLPRIRSKPCVLPIRCEILARTSLKLTVNASKSLQYLPVLKYKRSTPVCLFGGERKSGSGTEGSAWKSVQKSSGSFEMKSIVDVLREQIEKQEYAADHGGGSGGKPPRGTGGGGGGDSGGSQDKGLNETLQLILATIGFLLVYLYTIYGEDMILLARDFIKFLCTGIRTVRLRKSMEWWGQRWPSSRKRMAQRKSLRGIEDEDEDEDDYAYQ